MVRKRRSVLWIGQTSCYWIWPFQASTGTKSRRVIVLGQTAKTALSALPQASPSRNRKEKLSRAGFDQYFTKPMDVTNVAHVFDHIDPAAR